MRGFPAAKISRRHSGFTLLELLTTVVVMGILALMTISSFAFLRAKAERAKCVRNLQGLYAAGTSYLTDQGSWPQIATIDLESPEYAKGWIAAFKPYGLGAINWQCATVEAAMGNPPDDPEKPRIDYIGTTFDERPGSPWQWPTHPWFIERASVHGDGNLIVFTNGQIRSLDEVRNDGRRSVVVP